MRAWLERTAEDAGVEEGVAMDCGMDMGARPRVVSGCDMELFRAMVSMRSCSRPLGIMTSMSSSSSSLLLPLLFLLALSWMSWDDSVGSEGEYETKDS